MWVFRVEICQYFSDLDAKYDDSQSNRALDDKRVSFDGWRKPSVPENLTREEGFHESQMMFRH